MNQRLARTPFYFGFAGAVMHTMENNYTSLSTSLLKLVRLSFHSPGTAHKGFMAKNLEVINIWFFYEQLDNPMCLYVL